MQHRASVLCAAVCLSLIGWPQAGLTAPVLLPDGRDILPLPPAAGSYAQQADVQAYESTRALEESSRWQLAQNDADLKPQHVIDDFSCAAGFTLNPEKLPSLLSLLNTLADPLEQRVTEEKDFWRRPRPFIGNDAAICTPEARARLTTSFAYPSGHTTWGWLVASILASALPDRSTQIMQRGRIFGESRIVCGVHWKSDVQAGYVNGGAMFAALQDQPWFVAKMATVRAELGSLRTRSTPPNTKTCTMEHEAATNIF